MERNDFIFSMPQLREYLTQKGVSAQNAGISKNLSHPFYLLVPKYYIDLINWHDKNDPLRKMVIISDLESDIRKYEREDPIGDKPRTRVPGIIHRYPDRCLLMLTNICAVHCRFCFRKSLLDQNKADYKQSLTYISNHEEIWEVILSGGDPFMLTDHFIRTLYSDLRKINHVKTLRFHTRTPAVYPKRVTDEFIQSLDPALPTSIVIHINHPREITPEFIEVVDKMKKKGLLLLSQTVLMKGVNDDSKILADLFKKLILVGIKPYYLHHPDLAQGTHYFRVSVEEGKRIYTSLRGTISGICIPEYVIDTPGGYGKIPVMWFQKIHSNTYSAKNFEGKQIEYMENL